MRNDFRLWSDGSTCVRWLRVIVSEGLDRDLCISETPPWKITVVTIPKTVFCCYSTAMRLEFILELYCRNTRYRSDMFPRQESATAHDREVAVSPSRSLLRRVNLLPL